LAILGYGFAYRVLDAQYFGVAQRRKRVFVVGYLGDWRPAAAVLFERHSLSGHPAPSREKGKEVAGTIAARFGSSVDMTQTLQAKNPMAVAQPVYELHSQDSRVRELGDVCSTVSATYGAGGGNVPITLMQAMAVRRLTPVECERLQGFPDRYTDIQPKGKATPDGPRSRR